MQNNNRGNQNTSIQAVPNPNMKPKFSCKDCSFTCSSLQNFRIHLQTVHHKANENAQNMSTLKIAEKPKGIAVPNIQTEIQKGIVTPKIQPEIQKGIVTPKIQPEIQKGIVTPKIQPETQKGNVALKTQPEIQKGKVTPKIQPEIQKRIVSPKIQSEIQRWRAAQKIQSGLQKGNVALKIQPEIKKWKAAEKIQPEIQTWKAAPKTQPEKQMGKITPNIQPEPMHGNGGRHIAKLKDYISRADREPLIGLEYVLEYRFKTKLNQIDIRYFCELCECDTDRDPMVEHLAGFGHRKLYLAKEYPYVLKAQSNSKEDQSQFIRRMALEIEREEGTKIYMTDTSIWVETMMALRTADKKMKKKTRWDDDKNDQTRMRKALNFLGTFEIESEIESTTVTRLCEKLTANLKLYKTRTKQNSLFPARVARAQDVAYSLIKNAARQRTHLQNPNQKKGKPKMPPQLNKRPPTFPENVNLKNKAGLQSGFPGANFQYMNAKQNIPMAPPYHPGQNMPMAPPYQQGQNMPMAPPYQPGQNMPMAPPYQPGQNMPMAPPYQSPQKYPFFPLNQKQARQVPPMLQMNEFPQKAGNTQSDDSFLKNISQEDTHFFKKLMTLLEVLPQNASPAETTQMNSKLLMLKSLLENQKSAEHEQANQKLMTQIASMVQDTISAQNASLNQQLMMLMTSQNSTSMVMQTASLRNNLADTDGLVPGIQSSGTMQTNVNSLMPFNQSFGSQTYGQMEGNALRPMDQNAQVPQVASQNYPSTSQNYPSTSQNYDNFGYGTSVAGDYFPQGSSYVSQHDDINSLTTRKNEQKRIPYTDVGYESRVVDKEWDESYYGKPSTQVPEASYVDHSEDEEEEAAYTRVCLSPSSPRNLYDYDDKRGEIGAQDLGHRSSLRSYNSADWDDREDDMRYIKRPRLDMDNRSDRSENYYNRSLESLGINTADMPEELIKRIQGKDMFTASAIISEYSERHSGK